jgi:hypothetical protein
MRISDLTYRWMMAGTAQITEVYLVISLGMEAGHD